MSPPARYSACSNDPVASESTAERPHGFVEYLDLAWRQLGELVEPGDPTLIEQLRELGADALQLPKVIGRTGGAG